MRIFAGQPEGAASTQNPPHELCATLVPFALKKVTQSPFFPVKNYQLHIIIGLMSVALLGIIGLQAWEIRKAIRLSQKNFRSSVNDALNQVVDRLEAAQMKTRFVRVSRELNINFLDAEGSAPEDGMVLGLPADGEQPRPRRVRIRDSVAIVTEQEALLPGDSIMGENGGISYTFYAGGDRGQQEDVKVELRGHPDMVRILSRSLESLNARPQQLRRQVDSAQVDTLLRQALADQGLYLDYEFLLRNPALPTQPDQGQGHQIRLFPFLGGEEKDDFLLVSFPEEDLFALQTVGLQVGLSLLFCGIILFCFWITVRTIFRQKKYSEMKSDFINNMTHELKTPISTISLATDALRNPQLQAKPEGVARYLDIIRDENQRMHRQVDRVLQAARFERQEIQLDRKPEDAHPLIEAAARHIEFQVQQRQGELQLDLAAAATTLPLDRVHFTNLITNLLDNANKYSPEAPEILLRSYNEAGQLVISVQDRGLGISKAEQARIFTRFYRVSTGNLHDVKGFGLGLSYVKDVVEAHGGSISVQSAPGRGSTFVVRLPLGE